MCALQFHWPSQIPDGKGVSDKKSHSKDQTLSAGAHVDEPGHETTQSWQQLLKSAAMELGGLKRNTVFEQQL